MTADLATQEQVQELSDRSVAIFNALQQFQEDVAVIEDVAGLAKRQTASEKQAITTRKWQKITVAGLIFDMLLTIAGGALFFRVKDNSDTLKTVQCNLYTLALSSGYHPEKHLDDLGTTPQESLLAYNNVYAQIIHDNNQLGCVDATEPDYVTDASQLPQP